MPLEGQAKALARSLIPGTSTERYRRLWRIGQFEDKAGYIYGRIGYESSTGQVERWDPQRMDFVERSIREGHTSLFAIRKSNLRIAFQLRTNAIRPGTFIGAFQALLHEAAPDVNWEVTGEVVESFEQWSAKVDRITRLTITIDRPNPTFKYKWIGNVIEDGKAKAFQIGLTALPGQGIDKDQELIREAIEQADYRGKISASGEKGRGKKVKRFFWRKSAQGGPRQRGVPRNPTTGEATKEGLRIELESGDEE